MGDIDRMVIDACPVNPLAAVYTTVSVYDPKTEGYVY